MPSVSANSGLWEMVLSAGPMVKFVLLVLLFFSVFSWAIIAYKMLLLRKIEKETASFYDLFWEKRQFAHLSAASKGYKYTPLVNIFGAAYTEITGLMKSADGGEPWLKREDLERFQRILRKAIDTETARVEYALGFLATTGNTAPFIGLFGTVWGIMASFRDIGAKGAANLAVVAPGISEALVATAMGLLAAIPAVMGYNHLVTRIGRLTTEMNNFSSDIMNVIEKQAGKKG
ncbi:MAG TPA: protein TolQ [Deltaproteobacteria bacterium]|nr:MAG: protein TolQ [Deltaproteobacteria bacterium GWA2_55_82]OGQ64080.1 MAG: protein TolQ [Deltaproteobacteria bacterium RIFCSPLOWO2_02_FULL_55_12]OIJ74532.1 MAG: protein TolQ [Deltaproteobacteria bacterium GWC2_55_46]HBG47195.1 protein TolQ [Deltaproteobacteria bacterium]HCY10743.1 protein TolQ [Deltaproteobacteria bacterium]